MLSLTFPLLQPLNYAGRGALGGALHPLPSELMLKTLHFTAHSSPASLHSHSVTFPESGVCWLRVWVVFLGVHLHKSTLKTVPSLPLFSC